MEPVQQTAPSTTKLGVTAIILASMPFCGYAACSSMSKDDMGGITLYLGSVALAVIGAVMGLIQVARGRNKRYGLIAMLLGVLSPIATAVAGIASGNFDMTSGRPFRRRGKWQAPGARASLEWVEPFPRIDAPAEAAEAWRKNAAMETASVAAFSHLSNALLALGAPPELITHAHQDALDELRHARRCYGVATALDGKNEGPAHFTMAASQPDELPSFESVATAAAIEGCIYEAASALALRRLSEQPDLSNTLRDILAELARDEERHAEHSFEIVAFCLNGGGASTQRAVDDALAAFKLQTAGLPEGLERFGVASDPLWRDCVMTAHKAAVARLASAQRAAA